MLAFRPSNSLLSPYCRAWDSITVSALPVKIRSCETAIAHRIVGPIQIVRLCHKRAVHCVKQFEIHTSKILLRVRNKRQGCMTASKVFRVNLDQLHVVPPILKQQPEFALFAAASDQDHHVRVLLCVPFVITI